jgi:hypothetical protein
MNKELYEHGKRMYHRVVSPPCRNCWFFQQGLWCTHLNENLALESLKNILADMGASPTTDIHEWAEDYKKGYRSLKVKIDDPQEGCGR